jgi:hypothetical protein
MLNFPQHIRSVSHPMVAAMYLKQERRNSAPSTGVLVIETVEEDAAPVHQQDRSFESYLFELLGDLEDLKNAAEKEVGPIDRVDIKRH